MNNAASQSDNAGEYDIEKETAASRAMLDTRIPARLNTIKLALVEIHERRTYEQWHGALMIDFVESIERNCRELLETFDKDRLPAAAWLARNLLELLVWVKYCGISRENAWRFHEDALRDLKGLLKSLAKNCEAMGIPNEHAATSSQLLREVASKELGLEDIDSRYLAVARASEAAGVDMGSRFGPSHRFLSKFAHPTAALVHGINHLPEMSRAFQATVTTHGVYYAANATIAIEEQLGMPPEEA
jgi:hypothetical protein